MSDVQTAIKAIKYTYKDLARDTGLSLHTIRAYLKGVRAPTEESEQKILAALQRQATKLNVIAMPAPAAFVPTVSWGNSDNTALPSYEVPRTTIWYDGVRIDGSDDEISGEFRED